MPLRRERERGSQYQLILGQSKQLLLLLYIVIKLKDSYDARKGESQLVSKVNKLGWWGRRGRCSNRLKTLSQSELTRPWSSLALLRSSLSLSRNYFEYIIISLRRAALHLHDPMTLASLSFSFLLDVYYIIPPFVSTLFFCVNFCSSISLTSLFLENKRWCKGNKRGLYKEELLLIGLVASGLFLYIIYIAG